MPFGESFLSTLRSNKAILLDKTKRFKKTKGSFGDITKEIEFDYHEATPEELETFKHQLQKKNRILKIKTYAITSILLVVITTLFLKYINVL